MHGSNKPLDFVDKIKLIDPVCYELLNTQEKMFEALGQEWDDDDCFAALKCIYAHQSHNDHLPLPALVDTSTLSI